ncbi:uncharacterized protein FLJ43738 [Megalops cyprinoides]|uniref:uncharacterized protein FLJ43738 n=1 Tax=Megalops cyprinoides TaxID=118141 RepID=UPI001863A502|nr:uncharacterized protein FLJ43738 [Megalops cyprinoides]
MGNDKQLISEELKVELNPLVIRILSASSMPASPIPFHVLKEKCFPVYCQYKFHNMTVHRTKGQQHGANVYFKDVNVILTGLLSPGELREYLGGPPLEIEVHDRDRKPERLSSNSALFGAEPSDNQLSSKHTTHSIFQDQYKLCNPCGIAKLDLSDLLHGQKCFKVSVPINSSPPLPLAGKEGDEWDERALGIAGVVDGPLDLPMPMGHYHDANSVLKVRIEIACPLINDSSSTEGCGPGCPFGRIIYMFKGTTSIAPTRLRSEILRINAAAFQLESYAEETIETALSCYKMNAKERESEGLDVVTGFHVLDGHMQLFVLEGLKDGAIKRLWNAIPIKLPGGEEGQVEILYNSALSFSNRLYSTLDLSLRPVHLHKQLELIMKESAMYVRDMVPLACLQALSRLSLLFCVKKLKDVVQSGLFPSAEMVLSLSREFGIVPRKGAKEMTQAEADTQAAAEMSLQRAAEKRREPLDNYNFKYMEWKQNMENEQLHGHRKDFIQVASSYKIQVPLNTSEQARELLCQEMAKEPVWRFCRSQEYQLALADTVDLEDERRASVARSKAAWRTYDGFRFPGFKSSIESNEHPCQPDQARVEELRKDFERYTKPPCFFGCKPPVTIHLAEQTLKQEQLLTASAQYHQRALSDEGSPGARTLPEFKCHMRMTQGNLGKLQDLLKDKPMKYSLRKPGMVLKPIPLVSVIQHPEGTNPDNFEGEHSPAFAPGPLEHHSLMWDSNAIPRNDTQHNRFHFTGYWRPHSFQYKRAALPLTEEEKSAQLFQQPATPPKTPAFAAQTQPSGNIVETRTYNSIYLHVI